MKIIQSNMNCGFNSMGEAESDISMYINMSDLTFSTLFYQLICKTRLHSQICCLFVFANCLQSFSR